MNSIEADWMYTFGDIGPQSQRGQYVDSAKKMKKFKIGQNA